MTKEEFKMLLAKHDLTANTFLDICDEWDKLKPVHKYELLREEPNVPQGSSGQIENNIYRVISEINIPTK